jgi:hypothetical protein
MIILADKLLPDRLWQRIGPLLPPPSPTRAVAEVAPCPARSSLGC